MSSTERTKLRFIVLISHSPTPIHKKKPNARVDRARRLHTAFDLMNQVPKHAPRAPVQRLVRRVLPFDQKGPISIEVNAAKDLLRYLYLLFAVALNCHI